MSSRVVFWSAWFLSAFSYLCTLLKNTSIGVQLFEHFVKFWFENVSSGVLDVCREPIPSGDNSVCEKVKSEYTGVCYVVFGQSSVQARTMIGQCSLMFVQSLEHIQSVLIAFSCSNNVLAMFWQSPVKVWCKFGVCSEFIRSMFGQCSENVRTMLGHWLNKV